MVELIVKDIISRNLDHVDGEKLYITITENFSKGNVLLNFSGIDVITPSFLNTSFRVLIKEFDYSFLKNNLVIMNANSLIIKYIRQAVDEALKEKELKKA